MNVFHMLNVATVLAATQRMRDLNTPAPVEAPAEPTLSPKAQELVTILDSSDFGCQQANVHKILSALIGEELPEPVRTAAPTQPFTFVKGAMIKRNNELRLIYDLDGDEDALPMTAIGDKGGYISRDSFTLDKVPTDDEIRAAIEPPAAEAQAA